jgi:hypothetical protein
MRNGRYAKFTSFVVTTRQFAARHLSQADFMASIKCSKLWLCETTEIREACREIFCFSCIFSYFVILLYDIKIRKYFYFRKQKA